MGDRSQIAVKQDGDAKVYLYGHWIGADIYPLIQRVIRANQRLDDVEYLTRIIAREMGMGKDGETGYGIGLAAHGDIQHIIPVINTEARRITFEQPEWEHNQSADAGKSYSFAEFAALPHSTFADW